MSIDILITVITVIAITAVIFNKIPIVLIKRRKEESNTDEGKSDGSEEPPAASHVAESHPSAGRGLRRPGQDFGRTYAVKRPSRRVTKDEQM